MVLKDTTSCAMQEISGLLAFSGDPKGAMKAFCRLTFDETGETAARWGNERTYKGSLYSFYLFSAAVDMTPAPYAGWKSNYYSPYAKEFSKFILENKLGDVWESPIKQNKTFHTQHGNQIYVWTIDQDAVKKWWQENKMEEKVVRVVRPAKKAPDQDFILEDLSYDEI